MTLPDQVPRRGAAHTGTESTHILYEGLDRPARLVDAARLLPTLSAVVHGWPATMDPGPPHTDPFATLRPLSSATWELDAHLGAGAKSFDPVNAVCDFVAELSWERLRSRPDLLCLHAAAVAFGDHLVLFPSGRRSGKSTLAAALARAGHRLFSDDFVPVDIDPADGIARGLANGIAPRLRQPLPADSSGAFRTWVGADPGPANRQYKYLTGAPLAPANTALPLGAVVVLDRRETATPPRLEAIAPEDTLSQLIVQNFARTAHAGDILRAIRALVSGLATYRLVYSGFEEAAAFLAACDALRALSPARIADARPGAVAAVLPDASAPAAHPAFDPAVAYVQAPGFTEAAMGEDSFLADGDGSAIHRLNPGSTLIWRLVEEPMRLDDVVAVMAEVFADVEVSRLRADADRMLRDFLAARLIRPSGD